MARRQKISDLQLEDLRVYLSFNQNFFLEDLPDEMILKVLSYVNIADLMRCGQVSKRIRKVRNIESLWRNVNLDVYGDQMAYDGVLSNLSNNWGVKASFIKFLLDKGCECLNLSGVQLKGSLKLDGPSKLKRLKLDECCGNKAVVKEILNSCHSLQKLALQEQRFDFHFVKQLILRNSKTFQTINLASLQWLKDNFKVDFFGRCLELTEFKMTGDVVFENQNPIVITEMQSDQLDLMIDSFLPNLLKVELSAFVALSDLHVEKLVRRCNKITVLSLSTSDTITNQSVTNIFKNLKNSLEVLDLGYCYNVSLDNIFEAVRNLTKLKVLHYDVHNGMWNCACGTCESLMKERPGLIIYNGFRESFENIVANVDNYDD